MNDKDQELLEAILEDWRAAGQTEGTVGSLDLLLLRADNAEEIIPILPEVLQHALWAHVSGSWSEGVADYRGRWPDERAQAHKNRMRDLALAMTKLGLARPE